MRLRDKVAIITGSGRGLGKLYAERFAKEGSKVTVCDVIDCGETVKAIESRFLIRICGYIYGDCLRNSCQIKSLF